MKIEKCPFCGGTPILELFNDGFFDYARIRCCRVMFDWCGDETGEQAIAAWNRRVDTMQVVRGEWEPANPICPVCGEDKFKGLDADIWSDWTPAYCPNCGAKMEDKS